MICIRFKINLIFILLSVLVTGYYGEEDYTGLTKKQLIEKIKEKVELCKIYFKRKFDKDVDVISLTEYEKLTNKELIKKLKEYPVLFDAYNFVKEFGPDGKGNGTVEEEPVLSNEYIDDE